MRQSINVVENREFRDLLLFLKPELIDGDIPHRTKIRAAIVEHWRLQFSQLKMEIKVDKSLLCTCINIFNIQLFRLQWDALVSRWTSGLQEIEFLSWG